jgi:hypothetical protein
MNMLGIIGEIILILGVYAAISFLSVLITMLSLTATERMIIRMEERKKQRREEKVVHMHQEQEKKGRAYA